MRKLSGHPDCVDHGMASPRYANKQHNGRPVGAHRLAYCQANGLELSHIKGLVVRHKCDNPRCINPEHLEIGTYADNSADMVARGRYGKVRRALSDQDAEDIRRDYIPGSRHKPSATGQPQLAAKYGVKQSVISQILRGITYTTKVTCDN